MAQIESFGPARSQTSDLHSSPVFVDTTLKKNYHGDQSVKNDHHVVSDSIDDGANHVVHQETRSLAFILSQWRWEFACWVFGTLCIAAMVTILLFFRNKPLDDWHSRLQISAIISALSQAAQSALMVEVSSCIGQLKWPWLKTNRQLIDIRRFDDATRGPEGSLMLLGRALRNPEGILVSLGALITVLMLGFGTFIQQTVRIDNKEFALSIPAELSYASTYKPSTNFWKFGDSGGLFKIDDLYMQKAILTGLTTDDSSMSDVVGSCYYDHCSWPQFDSLGVCVSLEDMSSKVISRTNSTSSSKPLFSIEGVPIEPPTMDQTMTFWMKSTSFGSEDLPAPQQLAPSKLSGIANVYLLYMDPCAGVNQTSEPSNVENYGQEIKKAKNWRAFKASFRLCVQSMVSEFNVTMNTTVKEERVDDEWQAVTEEHTDTNIISNYWCDPINSSLCIQNGTIPSIGKLFESSFTGAASLYPGGDNYLEGENIEYHVADFLGADPTHCNPTQYTSNHGFTAFSNRMKNVSITMSNAMREADTQSIILGTNWQQKPFIFVDFAWFAFPSALWLMATVFFFVTVLKTKRSDIPIWKSNPLVLLQVKDEYNKMEDLKSINDEARSANTGLRYRGDGWSLGGGRGTNKREN